MSNIQTLTNTLKCNGANTIGTGLNHCPFDLKDMSGEGQIHLYKRGFRHTTDELTKAYYQGLQASGDLIILKGIFSVEDNSSDNQVETSSGGIERLATEGKYKWTFTFSNGRYFNKALSTLQSFGRYDLALSDGYNELHYVNSSGEHGGFSIGQLQHGKYVMASGGTSAKSSIMLQLTNKRQFDEDFGYVSGDSLGFSFSELDGINQVDVSFRNVPTNAGTTLDVDVFASADKSTPTGGLEVADFKITKNGAEITPSNVSESESGKYSLTVDALATDDEITAEIKDVVNKDGFLYQSLVTKTVVTA